MGSRKWINVGGNTIEIEMGRKRKRNFSRPPLSSPHPHDRISLSSPPSPRPPPHAASARSATGPRPWALRPSLLEPSSPARIIRLGAQALSHLPRPPPSAHLRLVFGHRLGRPPAARPCIFFLKLLVVPVTPSEATLASTSPASHGVSKSKARPISELWAHSLM